MIRDPKLLYPGDLSQLPQTTDRAAFRELSKLKAGTVQTGAGLRLAQVTQSHNYTLTLNDFCVFGDTSAGAITFTLPSPVGIAGQNFVIKKIAGSHRLTLAGNRIDGAPSAAIDILYSSLDVVTDGVEWWIL